MFIDTEQTKKATKNKKKHTHTQTHMHLHEQLHCKQATIFEKLKKINKLIIIMRKTK